MSVDLSVVVAVYNEHPKNLLALLERLYNVLSPLSIKYEVVFVNDGSRAETTSALFQIAGEVKNVKLVSLSRNFGQQAAISAGLDHADGKAIVNIDSDLQDPPELIPEMLRYWQLGYDVVYAQRSTRRDRIGKRLSAFLFYRVLRAVSDVDIPWDTGDFRLVDRKVVEALNRMPEKTRFLRGQIPWLGFRQTGIAIDRGAREVGESTYTLKRLIKLAMDGLLAFSSAPLHIVPTVGAVLSVFGALGFISWLLLSPSLNWPLNLDGNAIVSLLAVFTGVQLLCLGTVSIYLAKVLDEVRGRPTYIVADYIKGGRNLLGADRSYKGMEINCAPPQAELDMADFSQEASSPVKAVAKLSDSQDERLESEALSV